MKFVSVSATLNVVISNFYTPVYFFWPTNSDIVFNSGWINLLNREVNLNTSHCYDISKDKKKEV
jgi:hypothetical protein